jgi:uncharacterized membrane protein
MLGMGPLGIAHTLIGLAALLLGLTISLMCTRISLKQLSGKIYIALTAITSLTGFGIFEHGGFGKPHALGVVTLIALAFAMAVERSRLFGRNAQRVSAVAYSATLLFHLIPGITETSTRLPVGAPLLSSPDAPQLQLAYLMLFIIFCLFGWFQVLHIDEPQLRQVAPPHRYVRK